MTSKPIEMSQHAENAHDDDNVMEEKTEPSTIHPEPVISAFATWTRAQCIRRFWRLYLTGVAVSLSAMYAGYANSVIGSIIANAGFIAQFATVRDPVTGQPALSQTHISLWSAVYFISAILIQFLAPITADRWGRKFNMWAVTFFLTLAVVLQCVANVWWVLLIARFVAGFAGGMMGTSVMVYMSEMAMPQFRGALLGSFSLGFAMGQVFQAVALKVVEDTAPLQFRVVFYSEFVFCGLWLLPMVYLPESPAWYAGKGRDEEGRKALRRLVGRVEGYDVAHEYAVIKYEIEQSRALAEAVAGGAQANWKAMLTRVNVTRSIVATLPFTFQNVVGVPLMFGYTTYFFQIAGVSDPFLGNIVKQLVLVVGVIVSFYFVDTVGRRSLVIYGGLIMAVICAIVGGLGFLESSTSSGIALVALTSLWAFVYANTLAPIGWISLVEVSSPALRAKTTSIAVTIQYLSGILFNYIVPLMLSDQGAGWGQKTGLFFSGVTVVYLIPCVLLYPETKNRTYQELDELFEKHTPAWRFASTKTSHQLTLDAQREVLQ